MKRTLHNVQGDKLLVAAFLPVLCLPSQSGPGCSKLTTSLVNNSLNFQKLISQICQYFFVEKMCHLSTKDFSVFQCSRKTLNELTS